MDNEQFEKKIDWLESERRTADQNISELERRMVLLEEALSSNQELANSYKREMSRLNTAAESISNFSKEIRTNKSELEVEIRSNDEQVEYQSLSDQLLKLRTSE